MEKSPDEVCKEVVLSLVIVDEKVLLLKEKEGKHSRSSKWCLPGGLIVQEESMGEALSRSLLRDIGIKELDGPEYITLYEVNHREKLAYRVHAFKINKKFPFLINMSSDFSEIYFASQETALDMDLVDTVTRTMIEKMYD